MAVSPFQGCFLSHNRLLAQTQPLPFGGFLHFLGCLLCCVLFLTLSNITLSHQGDMGLLHIDVKLSP